MMYRKIIPYLLVWYLSATSLLDAQAPQTGFGDLIANAAKELQCSVPDEQAPVSVNAVIVRGENAGELAVVVKVTIALGWHIYAYVPADQPYIVTDQILQLPDGVLKAGAWIKSHATPSSTDRGVLNYEKEAVFYCLLISETSGSGTLKAGILYQACNNRQCLPPQEKTMELNL